MGMNFFNSWRNKDGSHVTQEWTADEMFDFGMLKYVVLGVILSLISTIASAICLIARIWDYEEGEKQANIVGIATAAYFLIDFYLGWPVTWVLGIMMDASTIKTMVLFNIALIVAHVGMLVFGDRVFDGTNAIGGKRRLVVFMLFLLALSYNIIKAFV